MDEKSLIKKYQNEIRQLKDELDQLKRGILSCTPSKDATEDNVILWKQKVIGLYALYFCILLAFTLFVVSEGSTTLSVNKIWVHFSFRCQTPV
jgi:hypothetical protein